MRISTVVSAGALALGLAVMIPTTILASAESPARHRDCVEHCYYGNCSGWGDPCHCYCDSNGYPYCWCYHGT